MTTPEVGFNFKDIYLQAGDYWQRLKPFFPRAGSLLMPQFIFFNDPGGQLPFVVDNSGKKPLQPESLPEELTSRGLHSAAIYINHLHTVGINLQEISRHQELDMDLDLSEEITHAATCIDGGEIWMLSRGMEAFDGFMPGFGSALSQIIKRLNLPFLIMDVNEFFPPLGQCVLLGESYPEHWVWEKAIIEMAPLDFSSKPEVAPLLEKIIFHLPRLAGELLVKQYNRDVQAILEDHPSLLKLKGRELFDEYCIPLLINGRLE